MPNIKSAKKRVKTNERQKNENLYVKGAMKTAVKKAVKGSDDNNKDKAYKAIDKALKKGIIKKNTAARKKSRVAKMSSKAE